MPKFNQLGTFIHADVIAAIKRDDPDELLYVPVAVSLNAPELAWAIAICTRLASHDHPLVRGNAVLGFGRLARRGALTVDQVVFDTVSVGDQITEYSGKHSGIRIEVVAPGR